MKHIPLICILIISFSCNPELNILKKGEIEKYPVDPSGTIYTFFDVDIKPVILEKTTPFYTKEAVDAGAEGTVIVLITVLATGEIESVDITKSINPQLDDEAVAAAKNSKFQPAIKDGKRVKCKLNVPFKFSLK